MPFSPEHLRALRADSPSTAQLVHLNNAGAGLMPRPVLNVMLNYLEQEAAQGGYETAAARREEIGGFFTRLATLFGGRPDQYAFCSSATDAFNKALSSIPVQAGDVWLTTRHDYTSNQIALLQAARRFGLQVIAARDREGGGVDLDDLQRLIRTHRPSLVVVTHVPSHTGLVQPVAEIGRLCREAGSWYLVDGCQAAGQLALDLPGLGCDFFSATFRKFLRGPRGAGFLYTSDRVLRSELAPLYLDLHSARWEATDRFQPAPDARRFELWERSYALVLGAAEALAYAHEVGVPAIETRVKSLADRLRKLLGELPGVRILDKGEELAGIVAVQVDSATPQILQKLREEQIHASIAYGEYARYTLDAQGVQWALRFSPHYYNTETELEKAAETLRRLLSR